MLQNNYKNINKYYFICDILDCSLESCDRKNKLVKEKLKNTKKNRSIFQIEGELIYATKIILTT